MAYELLNPLQVVCRKFLNIIVASTIHVVGWVFMLCTIVKLPCMVKWHNLVTPAMDDENWAVYVWHPVDIREFVEG